MCENCSKLTIEAPGWSQWHSSSVLIVEFEQVKIGWVDYFVIAKIRRNTENVVSKDAYDIYEDLREHFRYCNGLNLPLHNEITRGDIASVDDQLIDSEFVINVTSAKKR